MVASPELLETVIQQLYVEDSPSLTEACRLVRCISLLCSCVLLKGKHHKDANSIVMLLWLSRLLSAGLHSEVAGTWVDVLKSEDIVERIMWIAGNTMNSNLLEKASTDILAAWPFMRLNFEHTLRAYST